MSALSDNILERMKSFSVAHKEDGLPPEEFAKFLIQDDPYRDQIIGERNGNGRKVEKTS